MTSRNDASHATARWVRELVSLGGRNRMLYYRDLTRGTLRLDGIPADIIGRLLQGEPLHLDETLSEDRRIDGIERLRVIARKARENVEEQGVRTLFLALGIATWDSRRQTAPRAPVLFYPVEVDLTSAGRGAVLTSTGPGEVNPALALAIADDAGEDVVTLEADLSDLDSRDPGDALPAIAALIEPLVDGFVLDNGAVIVGNFSYEKLPMVTDLTLHAEQVLASSVVAAIAGDESARSRLRSSYGVETGAGTTPSEWLPLDADPSQRRVVDRVLRGESIVVEGPPGTGKSQTIANLIAALSAVGKSTLFVAEKRAAIDAVASRLNAVGLSDLMFDLHGHSLSRRVVVERLGRAIDEVDESVRGPGTVPTEDRDPYLDAVHGLDERIGGSLFDVIEALNRSGWPDRVEEVDTADQLTIESASNLANRVHEWALRGGTSASPWRDVDDAQIPSLLEARTRLSGFVRIVESTLLDLGVDGELAGSFRPAMDLPSASAAASMLKGRYRDAVLAIDATALERDLQSSSFERYAAARLQLEAVLILPDSEPQAEDLAILSRFGGVADHLGWRPATFNDVVALGALASEGRVARRDVEVLSALLDFTEAGLSIRDVASLLERLGETEAVARSLNHIRQLESQLVGAGLGSVVLACRRRHLDPDEARNLALRSLLSRIASDLIARRPDLRSFDSRVRDHDVAAFRKADKARAESAAASVRSHVLDKARESIDRHPAQVNAVLLEARKTRRHASLRELLLESHDVLLAVRPCWTMSPLMVSQLLPGVQGLFDVVIFDEASQVRPADAIPALYRARQVALAGDRFQLPPTTFFMSGYGEDDAVDESALGITADYESILDLLSALLPAYTLEWHYRSQDDRLIAFSNSAFYGDELLTFPGVGMDSALRHVRVMAVAPDGRRASNPHEVEKVVELVADHLSSRPSESLGVVALGLSHAEELERAIVGRLGIGVESETVLGVDGEERVFVKNLERVQGDERDAIILSLGYSPGSAGKLNQNFGPINHTGGERRLNVAVTRARRRLTVVSSFGHSDLDTSQSQSRGLRMLKDFLAYAERGGSAITGGEDSTSPLAAAIAARLRAEGLKVVTGLGTSRGAVDLAVSRPGSSDKLFLAVEVDGVRYRELETRSDRDRLRPEVLERLGWSVHRVWSVGWYQNPEAEITAILARLKG